MQVFFIYFLKFVLVFNNYFFKQIVNCDLKNIILQLTTFGKYSKYHLIIIIII